MVFLYVAIVILAGLGALFCLIAGMMEGEWSMILIGVLLTGLVIGTILIPQAQPDQLTYIHKTLLTDTYNDIKYDKVIRVEYDTRKGPWWSWQCFDEDVNFKIITEVGQ